MPSLHDLRNLLTDRSSIKGKVEWFGDWSVATIDRFSDTEVRITPINFRALGDGEAVILKGLGFPFDGIRTVKDGVISFEESHDIEASIDVSFGVWQSWNVYDPEALTLDRFLRFNQIHHVERPSLLQRPEVRAQEQAALLAQARGIVAVASEMQELDVSGAMAMLQLFLDGDRSEESAMETIEELNKPNSLTLAKVADRLRAMDYSIDMKAIQMESVKELMPKLETLAGLDFSILHRIQDGERQSALTEMEEDQEFIKLIGEEAEILCMMPPDLLLSHSQISRQFQAAVMELYKEIRSIVDNSGKTPTPVEASQGKSKSTRPKNSRPSAIVS